jgi:hypothetical protein
MRRFKSIGFGVLAVLVLTAFAVSSASAATDLDLKLGGEVAKVGAPAFAAAGLDECVTFTEGKLTANGKTTDKATFTTDADTECPEGQSLSGTVKSATLTTKGAAKFTAKLDLTIPGPCVYEFKTLSWKFTPNGGDTLGEFEEVTGKLSKKGSAKGCAATHLTGFTGGIFTSVFGEIYETALT